ncbi:MAG: O-antigen ligase family protein [Daejeonella sp.]
MTSFLRQNLATIEKIEFFLLASVIATLPFLVVINSILIILLFVQSLALFYASSEKRMLNLKQTLLLAIPFLIYLIPVLIRNDWRSFPILETKFSLLVIPIAFGLNRSFFTKQRVQSLLVIFIISSSLAASLTFKNNTDFLFNRSMEIADYIIIRRPYFGLYICFCALTLIYILIESKYNFLTHVFKAVFIFSLLYFAYLIYAKMALIGFFLAGGSYLLFYLGKWVATQRKLANRIWPILGILGFVIVIGFVIINWANLSRMFWGGITEEEYHINVTSSWVIRKLIWNCAMEILAGDGAWLTGLPISKSQEALNHCYQTNYSNTWFINERFNAHNEFLQIWIHTGIFGVTSFLIFLGWLLWSAINQKKIFYVAFLVLTLICGLTESLFLVQKGVVFFSIFNSLLYFETKED